MKAQISRFHSSHKVAHVSGIRSYGEFKQAWERAERLGLKPHLIGDGHLNCKNPLAIYPAMFDAVGKSTGAVEEYVARFNVIKLS